MAKILVADDNSNVQKTVTLALAELGVEVVSVNNGEAAVRKLADFSPDLVLADIFMPVRNGYEVCEYIKKDARFSHLPVVLLVGAFDPLDEREAKRVGADGILKKPFVPPDPLITMVKMLLERTLGERLVTVGAPEAAVAMRGKAGGIATAEAPPAKAGTGSASIPEAAEVFPAQEFQPPPGRLSFGDGARPMAFESLLGTLGHEPAAGVNGIIEPVEDEQILTSSRDASLGDPVFWKNEEPEPETSEETSAAEQDLASAPPLRAWKPDEEAAARSLGDEVLQPVEPFELVREESDSNQASTVVETSEIIAQDAASQAALNVDSAKPEDLAANPLEWMASVPPPPADEVPEALQSLDAAVVQPADNIDAPELSVAVEVPEPLAAEPPAAAVRVAVTSAVSSEPLLLPVPRAEESVALPQNPIVTVIPELQKTQPSLAPVAQSSEENAHSDSMQDWADLAASVQINPAGRAADKPEPVPAVAPAERVADAQLAATFSLRPPKLLGQSAEETARSIPKSDWADLTASLQPKRTETAEQADALPVTENTASPVAEKTAWPAANRTSTSNAPAAVEANPASFAINGQAAPANSASPAAPDPVLVEAVVQRILEKMRPQVVEIITKEFLRPIVQALVTREITKR